MASLWMIQSGFRKFLIGYDAVYAEKVAAALASPHTNKRLVDTVACIRETLQQTAGVSSMHVRSHRGDPWNELADVVCGTVSLRGTGFTFAAVPDAFTSLVADGGRKLLWLPFEVMSEDRKSQYPLRDVDGQFNLATTWRAGIAMLDDSRVVEHLSRPVNSSIASSQPSHCDGGILAVFINVQSLERGDERCGWR